MIYCAKRFRVLALTLSLLLVVPPVWAFELNTHSEITAAAFIRSAILNAFRDLAIDPQRPLNAGFLRGSRPPDRWLDKGARDEDDIFSLSPFRFRHHFYDPVNDRGLTTLLVSGERAPDWALEDRRTFFTQNFSYRDAREDFLTALTAPAPSDREAALARTFESLGHVIHLVQDMGSPPHTRNDLHGGFGFGPPSLYERHLNQAQVLAGLNFDGKPVRFGLPRQYWITGDGRGLAEFVNRNFVSERTNFTARVNGATGGGYPSPVLRLGVDEQGRPFETTLDVQTQLEPGLRDRNGNLIGGSLTFFANNFQDPITGEALRNDRMTTLSLFDRELERKGASPLFALNRYNVEAQAGFLLPRAVGYSAGLLDYFFRGKLDVDLVPDETDPSVVNLSGIYDTTDGSEDRLVEGTLALYADGSDRSEVPSLDPLEVRNVVPGQEISRRFQVTQETDRFIAVYQGTLGREVRDPANNFPGGVIGKVLGGVRAESIFPQGDKRMLRTVPVNGVGIFPFPAEADRLENIQWGDQDNTFAGILSNPATPRSPDQILAFKINRPLGSGEVPLVDGPGGTQVVSAEVLKNVGFPFDLPLGVTVNYSQTFRVQQARLAFDVIDTNVFDENTQSYNLFRQVTSPIVQTVLDQTIPFSQSFPIVLDRAHHCSQSCFAFDDFPGFIGPIIRPYVWKVKEVTLDQRGRLLALVDVFLIEPDDHTRTGNLAETDIYGRGGWTVAAGFQVSGLLRGVVDLDSGNVLGVTSSATVSLSSQHAISFTSLKQHRVTTYVGGPSHGTTNETWILGRYGSGNPNFTTSETGTARAPTAGLLSEAILGHFRTDLESLVTTNTGIGTREFGFSLVYFVGDVTNTNRSIRIAFTSSFSTGTIMPLPQARMIRRTQDISPQVLLLFSQRVPGSFVYQEEGIPVRWSPQSPENTALALSYRLPPGDSYSLLFTTSQAALLYFADFGVPDPQLGPGVFTLLIDFATQQTQFFPGLLGFQYVLLEPKFLYNLNDTKFHTLDVSLRPTALPRRLADAAPIHPPTAAYHLIKLQ